MPVSCKNPRYRYKNNVRLTFCGKHVDEAKSKSHILTENRAHQKLQRGKRGGLYYTKNNKKVYVKRVKT